MNRPAVIEPVSQTAKVVSREPLTIANARTSDEALAVDNLHMMLPDGGFSVKGWRIYRGEKVALIGRNGAGKSSLIESMLGLRRGAALTGRILGHDMAAWRRESRLRARVGTQLQRTSLPVGLRVGEIVAIQRSLFSCTAQDVMESLDINGLTQKRYEWLSRGERQRVDLFLALGHRPELLFLDEPFSGLDPQFARACAELLASMSDMTIVMCCHTVDELRLASKAAWIDHGIRCYAPPDVLGRELLGEYQLRIRCASADLMQTIVAGVAAVCPARVVHAPGSAEAAFYGDNRLQRIVQQLVQRPDVNVEFGKAGLADLLRRCAQEA